MQDVRWNIYEAWHWMGRDRGRWSAVHATEDGKKTLCGRAIPEQRTWDEKTDRSGSPIRCCEVEIAQDYRVDCKLCRKKMEQA